MIKKLCLVGGLGLVAAAVFPACSSSSSNNGSSGSFSTGLPKDESLGSLSDADAQKLCDAFNNYATGISTGNSACKFVGITQAAIAQLSGAKTDADLRKACTDAETACQKTATTKVDAGTGTVTCNKPSSSCTATVGELETCMTDSSAATNKAFASIPECSALTASFFKSDGGGISGIARGTTPPSCQTVQQKCPGVVPGGMSSTTPPTP